MPVLTFVWTGAVSNSFGNNNNWSPNTRVPGTAGFADHVFIPKTASNHILTGTDRTGDNAAAGNHLGTFRIDHDSTVRVGALGSALKVTADELIHNGAAELYWENEMGSGADATVAMHLNGSSLLNAAVITGTNDIAEIYIHRGASTIGCSGTMTDMFIDAGSLANDPKLTLTHMGGGSGLHIYQRGGRLIFAATAGSNGFLYQSAGHTTIQQASSSGPTYIRMLGSGLLEGLSTATVSGAWLMGGTVDLTGNQEVKDWRQVWRFPGCDFRYTRSRMGTLFDLQDIPSIID